MEGTAHITRLPAETIQWIGSVCHPSDLIALSRTCRRLYEICNGKEVLRLCVFKHLGPPTSDYVTSKDNFRKLMMDDAPVPEAWMINKLAEQEESDDSNGGYALPKWEPWPTRRELWARLAAAAITLPSRIGQMEQLLHCDDLAHSGQNPLITHLEDWIPLLKDTLSTLTVLTVFAYPTVVDARAARVLATLAKHMYDPEYWRDYVQTRPSWNSTSRTIRRIARMLAFCVAVGSLGNDAVDVSGLVPLLSEDHDYSAGFVGPTDSDVLIVAPVIWLVRQQNAKAGDELPRLPRLPFLRNILNGEVNSADMMMDLPHPGNEIPQKYTKQPGWEWWFVDNARQLFIDHGDNEWMGFYTHQSQDGGGWEFQRMRGIQFVDREEWRGDYWQGSHWSVEAKDGIDGFGRFCLHGEYVSDEAHEITLYRSPSSSGPGDWSMSGSLTPLGIVGRWSGSEWNDPTRSGLVWLFKREWVEKGKVSFAQESP